MFLILLLLASTTGLEQPTTWKTPSTFSEIQIGIAWTNITAANSSAPDEGAVVQTLGQCTLCRSLDTFSKRLIVGGYYFTLSDIPPDRILTGIEIHVEIKFFRTGTVLCNNFVGTSRNETTISSITEIFPNNIFVGYTYGGPGIILGNHTTSDVLGPFALNFHSEAYGGDVIPGPSRSGTCTIYIRSVRLRLWHDLNNSTLTPTPIPTFSPSSIPTASPTVAPTIAATTILPSFSPSTVSQTTSPTPSPTSISVNQSTFRMTTSVQTTQIPQTIFSTNTTITSNLTFSQSTTLDENVQLIIFGTLTLSSSLSFSGNNLISAGDIIINRGNILSLALSSKPTTPTTIPIFAATGSIYGNFNSYNVSVPDLLSCESIITQPYQTSGTFSVSVSIDNSNCNSSPPLGLIIGCTIAGLLLGIGVISIILLHRHKEKIRFAAMGKEWLDEKRNDEIEQMQKAMRDECAKV